MKRFVGIVGRVVTVNMSGRAIIDFQDGGWYDIMASADCLTRIDKAEGEKKYKNVNRPSRCPQNKERKGSPLAA